jgi:hypothetical protein
MMKEQLQNDLFPALLRRPMSLWGVMILPSLLLTALSGFTYWLVWDGMKDNGHLYALTLTALSLLPAVAGLAAACAGARKAEGLPGWVHLGLAALCFAQLFAFCSLIAKTMPPDTPEWAVGPSFFLAQFACMMPGLFTGVWRLAAFRLRLGPLADFGVSLSAAVLPPFLIYLGIFVWSHLWRGLFKGGSVQLYETLLVAAMVVAPLVFFIGLLRCLLLARRYFSKWGEKSRAFHMGYVGCVALVLPVAGLLLNRKIPFPADFQNPWPYALTVANALFLMMPATGRRWLDEAARCGRLLLFPFTLYFFVVFLPFLPLAILATLAMGAGFLILAPTLLFIVHGQILRQDAAGGLRRHAWLRAALCLPLLPLLFGGCAEADRLVLHRTLDFRYAPDYGRDAVLPYSPAAVRRILLNVRRFKDGAEYPYLTNWYNWRVFDNLLLQDQKAEELWRLIVGGEPPKAVRVDFLRNEFASVFGGKTRSPDRTRSGGRLLPTPRNVALTDVRAAHSTTNGETETRAVLSVTSQDSASQAEYSAKLVVPPGVWVSGFRLKIGDTWQEGRVIERKAAEWVYRQIRDVSRRDPAILRYEADGSLSLRIFPIAPRETREVEIAFLCPEGFADAVLIGDRRVALGDGTVKPVCVWSEGVLARSAAWRWPRQAALEAASSAWYLALDCSAGACWDGAALSRVAEGLRRAGARDGTVAHVLCANYETATAERVALAGLAGSGELAGRLLPASGALDADGVLRRVARRCRFDGAFAPEITFAGHSVRAALSRVSAETWQAFRSELPGVGTLRLIGEDGSVSEFPVPEAAANENVAVLDTGSDQRRDAGISSAVIAFEGAPRRPVCRGAPGADPQPVEEMAEMPKESRWARGAAAWRMQREWEEHPSRESLRPAILKASRESGVLTPSGSYIVVENSMQWKMLEVKQRQTLAGDAALDLVESPAPSAWLVLALSLAALTFFRKVRRLLWSGTGRGL